MVAGEGLEPTVLHFLCGENAAVGSAALTAHRAVIHYRLTLRVMSHVKASKLGIFSCGCVRLQTVAITGFSPFFHDVAFSCV